MGMQEPLTGALMEMLERVVAAADMPEVVGPDMPAVGSRGRMADSQRATRPSALRHSVGEAVGGLQEIQDAVVQAVREWLRSIGINWVLARAGVASGLYAEQALRGWLQTRIEAELTRQAQTVRTTLEILGTEQPAPVMDRIATRLAASAKARVTIISAQGVVLGESDVPEEEIAEIENHAARPEVQSALASQRGVSRRYSTTVATDMLYVALPFGD